MMNVIIIQYNYQKYKLIICTISDLTNIAKYQQLTTEYINRDIYLDQLIVALLHIEKGGTIILKVDGLLSLLVNKLIYNVSLLFDKFDILSPDSGALYSGGIQHVIFKSYKDNSRSIKLINILKELSDSIIKIFINGII